MEEEIKKDVKHEENSGLDYEESFARVEEIIGELESGELSLKESIEKYENAVKSMNRCYELLDEAQKKIEILIKDSESAVTGKKDLELE